MCWCVSVVACSDSVEGVLCTLASICDLSGGVNPMDFSCIARETVSLALFDIFDLQTVPLQKGKRLFSKKHQTKRNVKSKKSPLSKWSGWEGS